ncbi:MAG: division/cell wall cluster transcriptional repressor MraZ [Pseudomonadales bacterium]|mgnify:FL=1|jgi:MraZ protein|nr:division/cell wall cluster transcriptional repressor MraZ [Pseudomonadales bacterium]MDP7144973.1 division/cell wall cluster transcriptional repressor MraZ [Pseudomonadales bacterium]MDP7357155.1 division/cell wall cluster transcriptional repressor MraZ [Pseudomonadales bacterium]MDP7594782.1 division/cell wall cluster transcriptional repressor MraZ [Pseudomonadales bacterium]HJN50039.1 division/cell wall cluster transcriptional repressor MraZ [Pseudomonadales bacterium]|tara:strand:+ start:812 stop:1264 length:453 start_codon:yes stop_codon:yes gene_type:complete
MFRGVSAINLDAKGRLAIPTRYRDRLAEHCDGQIVVTIDTDERCLLIYPLPQWEDIERKVEALPSFNPAARRVQRLLIGHATDIVMDGSGRILLPIPLREYARLEKKVVMLGQGGKLELWSEAYWLERRESWLEDQAELEIPAELRSLSL